MVIGIKGGGERGPPAGTAGVYCQTAMQNLTALGRVKV
jgi:hypothetical protein